MGKSFMTDVNRKAYVLPCISSGTIMKSAPSSVEVSVFAPQDRVVASVKLTPISSLCFFAAFLFVSQLEVQIPHELSHEPANSHVSQYKEVHASSEYTDSQCCR